MNTSIAALKRSKSNLDTLIGELNKVAEPQKQSNSYADDRFWKPELDKSGNGYAVFRFLPAVKDEDLPWARLWSHAFQGPGGWYLENSLTTMNKKDPVSESNSLLWNSGVDADKEIARKRKRKLSYIANVLIINDAKHPENEGQIKLFKFGKKIFDKITEAMKPEFEDEKPINPFDFWEGANFKLKIRKVDGFWNYDKSEFEDTSKLFEDDSEADKVWQSQYSLAEFTAPTNFKSYDELKTRLDAVLSGTVKVGNVADTMDDAPVAKPKVDTKPTTTKVETPVVEEDDTLAYFEKLLESILITPGSATVDVDDTQNFVATGVYSDLTSDETDTDRVAITESVSWQISDTDVATVSNTQDTRGQVTGVEEGSATLTASCGDLLAETQAVITVEESDDELSFNFGTFYQLDADSSGVFLRVSEGSSYSSSDQLDNDDLDWEVTTDEDFDPIELTEDGDDAGFIVPNFSTGQATVTVTDSSGNTASIDIEVVDN